MNALKPTLQDLYDEADAQGLRVLDHPLPDSLCGIWEWHNDTIWLDTTLSDTQRRCTLCHELTPPPRPLWGYHMPRRKRGTQRNAMP